MADLHVECHTEADRIADLPALARLRIRVFRGWRDLDEAEEAPRPTVFWLKHLD